MSTNLSINPDRLWQSLMASAEIGRTPAGGALNVLAVHGADVLRTADRECDLVAVHLPIRNRL